MANQKINFTLPIGYEDEKGVYHREGIMKPATALIEIEVNDDERIAFNARYRDCLIFSKVITRLGTFPEVTPEMIENLFEADFIYLQLLYNKLNTDFEETIMTQCPECSHVDKMPLTEIYKNMHHYYADAKKNTAVER
jgi:hypothetical protein